MTNIADVYVKSNSLIEDFLKKHYLDCSIQDLLEFKEAFAAEENQEGVQVFIDKKRYDLIKIWTEE